MKPTENRQTFEQSLDRLQQVVKQLESGELSLEDSLKSFEEGVRLSRECQSQLSDAEKKVEILMGQPQTGAVPTLPFPQP